MPKSETPLGEKPPFDVYAMFTILTFLGTLGATLILHKDLTENWRAGLDPMPKVAEGVTSYNSQTDADLIDGKNKPSKEPEITAEDLEDWNRLLETRKDLGLTDKPPRYKPYPAWLNPKKNPISTQPGKDNTDGVPPNVLNELKEKYVEGDALKGPEEGGAAKTESAPTTPEPVKAPVEPAKTPEAPKTPAETK